MIVQLFRIFFPLAFLCAIAANVHATLELKKGDRISLVGAGHGLANGSLRPFRDGTLPSLS